MKNVDKWETETHEYPPLKWWEEIASFLFWWIRGRLPLWHEYRIVQGEMRENNGQ